MMHLTGLTWYLWYLFWCSSSRPSLLFCVSFLIQYWRDVWWLKYSVYSSVFSMITWCNGIDDVFVLTLKAEKSPSYILYFWYLSVLHHCYIDDGSKWWLMTFSQWEKQWCIDAVTDMMNIIVHIDILILDVTYYGICW
jgi:hypothetical protein